MPQPEPQGSEHLINSQRFARQASCHHENECAKEQIDAEHLPLWIATSDRRGKQETSADIGGRDPKDGQLQVPGSQQIAWKKVRNVEAVEALRIRPVMRRR